MKQNDQHWMFVPLETVRLVATMEQTGNEYEFTIWNLDGSGQFDKVHAQVSRYRRSYCRSLESGSIVIGDVEMSYCLGRRDSLVEFEVFANGTRHSLVFDWADDKPAPQAVKYDGWSRVV